MTPLLLPFVSFQGRVRSCSIELGADIRSGSLNFCLGSSLYQLPFKIEGLFYYTMAGLDSLAPFSCGLFRRKRNHSHRSTRGRCNPSMFAVPPCCSPGLVFAWLNGLLLCPELQIITG